jgi:hypothetical protein
MLEIDRETIEIDSLGKLRLRVRYAADSRSDAIRNTPATLEGLPRTALRAQPWIGKQGKYLVDAAYEGLTDDPDPSFDVYELITEERENKIESFPDRALLEEDYGATLDEDGNLVFPPTLPKPASRLGQPLTLDTMKAGAAEPKNPLHGTKSYGVPHTTAIWRLVRKRVPAGLEKQSRSIIDRLPSGFDYRGPKSSWYVRPLQKRKTGNSWEIEWTAFEVSDFADLQVLLALQGKAREQSVLDTFFK